MKKLAFLALLLLPALAWGQSIDVPAKVEVESGPLVVIKASAFDADDLRWYPLSPGIQPLPSEAITIKPGFFLGVVPGPGTYKLGVVPAKCVNGKAVIGQAKTILVVVGGQPPLPPVPPTPPGPTPPPSPVTGLRVIFVVESADESKLPSGQIAAMNSVKVRQYLDAKCKGGKDGWRFWDKDQDVSKEPDPWGKIWAATKPQLGKLPAVVIVTDQSGEIFPVPSSVDEMMALLKKYGG